MAQWNNSGDSGFAAALPVFNPSAPNNVAASMRAQLGGPTAPRPQPGVQISAPAPMPRITPGYAEGTSQVAPFAGRGAAPAWQPAYSPPSTPSYGRNQGILQQMGLPPTQQYTGMRNGGLSNSAVAAIAAMQKPSGQSQGGAAKPAPDTQPAAPAPAPAPVAQEPAPDALATQLMQMNRGQFNRLQAMTPHVPTVNDMAGATVLNSVLEGVKSGHLDNNAATNLLLALHGYSNLSGIPMTNMMQNALGMQSR